MLNVLMFHQIYDAKKPKQVESFLAFIEQLSQRYSIVVPGQALKKRKASMCLTFDDAYYDFYKYVFPLLKTLQISAVLAVPVQYIVEETALSDERRLGLLHGTEMDGDLCKTHVPFCTWVELREMVESGFVKIASHGLSHCALTADNVDVMRELTESKSILERQIKCSVDTFVYLYGKFYKGINKKVSDIYPFSMRIGFALNHSWSNFNGIIYRVNADPYWKSRQRWSLFDSIKYFL